MFRRRYQSNGGTSLPTTSGNAPPPSVFTNLVSSSGNKNSVDGSAKSIHLENPLWTKWKKSSRAVKVCYTISLISFIVAYFGWRVLSYYSSKINIDCSTTDCTLTVRGIGRKRAIHLSLPRHQLLGAKPVKVNEAGIVVNDNVNINEEWKYEIRDTSQKTSKGNYKGPDKDGNYLTYVLRFKDSNNKQQPQEQQQEEHHYGDQDSTTTTTLTPAVSFDSIAPFVTKSTDEYFIVMRQHGIAQTRRRVRNLIQKIDSYAKKRRHKLNVKEMSTPDWRGILMMVLGGCISLLSLLLGCFWEDEEHYHRMLMDGMDPIRKTPGKTSSSSTTPHKKKHHSAASAANLTSPTINPYQRATPSKYEVHTTPRKIGNVPRKN